MIIDLHCDTLMKLLDVPAGGDLYRNCWNIDIEKLQHSGYLMQDFAIFVDLQEHPDAYARYTEMKRVFTEQVTKYADHIRQVRSYEDIESCRKDGVIGALLSIEEGGVLGGDMDRLQAAYDDGVRLITLTWNYPNELAYPNGMEGKDKGLTARGWEFVEWMQAHGVIVDTSHLNDQGTRELLERTERPIMASHSNARSIKEHTRNLPDDLLRFYGEKGGIIGLNFSRNFVSPEPITSLDQIDNPKMFPRLVTTDEYHAIQTGQVPRPTGDLTEPLIVSKVADIAKHARYMVNLAGIETVALGTDFDGVQPYLEVHDASEMDKLVRALKKEQFSDDDIDRIFAKNALRFLKDTLPHAEQA